MPRWLPFAASVGIHACVFCGIWFLPPIPDHIWAREEISQRRLTEGEPQKRPRQIIWLRRTERLPDVSPSSAKVDLPAPKYDSKKLYVRANPPRAKHWDQFIHVPQPTIEEQKPIAAPNVVMTDLTTIPAPPKADPKKFVPPKDRPREVKDRQIEVPELALAPEPGLGRISKLPEVLAKKAFPKPAPKVFVPPPEKPREVVNRVVDLPEGLPIPAGGPVDGRLALRSGQIDAPKPAGKKFVPPTSLQGNGGPAGSKAEGSGGQVITAPEVPDVASFGGVPGPISAVIISTNPVANGALIPPQGNRAAKIEMGSLGEGGKGSGSALPSGSGVVVPNLTVRGGSPTDGPGVTARNSMPNAPAASAAMTPTGPTYRPSLNTRTVSVPQWPNTRRVPVQVEEAFRSRVVYSTVIPGSLSLPDIVAWFGEVQPTEKGTRLLMRPPVADQTPVIPLIANPGEGGKLWVSARLGRNGRISDVKAAQGLAASLAGELTSGLGKWLFIPAIRNGEAVDVDLLLEIELKRKR